MLYNTQREYPLLQSLDLDGYTKYPTTVRESLPSPYGRTVEITTVLKSVIGNLTAYRLEYHPILRDNPSDLFNELGKVLSATEDYFERTLVQKSLQHKVVLSASEWDEVYRNNTYKQLELEITVNQTIDCLGRSTYSKSYKVVESGK